MSIATDPNLAAFLDESAYTVSCEYLVGSTPNQTSKTYTFITNIPGICPGDVLLVENSSGIRLSVRSPGVEFVSIEALEQAESVQVNQLMRISMSPPVAVRVLNCHDTVCIEPNSDTRYKWVIAKVDFDYYTTLINRNNTLSATVAESYKRAARKGVREQLLGMLPAEEQIKLKDLLGSAGNSVGLPITTVTKGE